MFSEAPELYDAIYGAFKDYRAESVRIAAMLKAHAPGARTVLDVGCGTGEHARHLVSDHNYAVHGLDIEPAFVDLAHQKVPQATFSEGDMSDFHLERRFDAIVCLFSSIGYLQTLDRVEAAFRCFAEHVEVGGVVIIEPWFDPADWHPGCVYCHTAEIDGGTVVRMSHSTVAGAVSVLDFHYLIGSERGIDHRTERHELGLFSREQLSMCFERTGFRTVHYDPEGLIGRGMFVAKVSE